MDIYKIAYTHNIAAFNKILLHIIETYRFIVISKHRVHSEAKVLYLSALLFPYRIQISIWHLLLSIPLVEVSFVIWRRRNSGSRRKSACNKRLSTHYDFVRLTYQLYPKTMPYISKRSPYQRCHSFWSFYLRLHSSGNSNLGWFRVQSNHIVSWWIISYFPKTHTCFGWRCI